MRYRSSKASKLSVDAVRKISLASLRATSLAVKVIRESEKEDYRNWAQSALDLLKDEINDLAKAAFDPRAGWDLVKNKIDILEVTRKKYSAKLPWPQPSPISFDGLAQTVLNVPEPEVQEFLDIVVSRYVKTLRRYWVDAASYSFQNPGLEPLNDFEFACLIEQTPLSRFLCPTLDPIDKLEFSKILKTNLDDGEFYKVDFSALKNLTCLPKLYVAPSVSLFEKLKTGALIPRAIRINGQVLQPKDTNAWELARYFVLQGGSLSLVAGVHPTVHFPMDAINALTKSIIPERHVVRQILEPHLFLQLPLNYAVLHIDRSVAHNNQREIYTPFPINKESFFSIMKAFYQGISENSAYPPYRFSLEPPVICSDYGLFISAYFETILEFVSQITATVKKRDPYIRRWAHYISQAVPGFPSPEKITEENNLARALTCFITNVSVIHSADHYSYASLSINKVPLRLRQPAPTTNNMEKINLKKLVLWEDIFRHSMAREMYFKPSTVRKLIDVQYQFETERDQKIAVQFQENLRKLDSNLDGLRFIPLDEIASSIQY